MQSLGLPTSFGSKKKKYWFIYIFYNLIFWKVFLLMEKMINKRNRLSIVQEQYSNTLFLRKTSNSDLRAKVYGNHPGTLMSRFLRAASCANTFSKLLTSSSYFAFSPLMTLFLSSTCLYNSLIWCFKLLILLSWMDFSS